MAVLGSDTGAGWMQQLVGVAVLGSDSGSGWMQKPVGATVLGSDAGAGWMQKPMGATVLGSGAGPGEGLAGRAKPGEPHGAGRSALWATMGLVSDPSLPTRLSVFQASGMFLSGVRRRESLWKPSMGSTTLPEPVKSGWMA